MRIALAADHAGFSLKQHMVGYLQKQGYEVIDLGVDTGDVSSDYPDAATAIAGALLEGGVERGLLICGSGIGACIAANKYPGIYAAICHDTYSARQGVEHDKMNVLCMGGLVIGTALAEEIATAFLRAEFDGIDRHARRFDKVQAIENQHLKG